MKFSDSLLVLIDDSELWTPIWRFEAVNSMLLTPTLELLAQAPEL